jgi:uncharacterized membrane protein YciS (DUF1049 family)
VKINEYIESGILEAYVLGAASETEAKELQRLKAQHPQIQYALDELELDLEHIAQQMAITPPPGVLKKIEDNINELLQNPLLERLPDLPRDKRNFNADRKDKDQYIEVEGNSSHIRIHKAWRWIFGAVFLLGKIFLALAIYFYLENRQLDKQVKKLEQELQQRDSTTKGMSDAAQKNLR